MSTSRPYEQVAALFAGLPPVVTAKELGGVLRLHEKTVFAKGASGELKGRVTIGRNVRFITCEVIEGLCRNNGRLGPIGGGRIQ